MASFLESLWNAIIYVVLAPIPRIRMFYVFLETTGIGLILLLCWTEVQHKLPGRDGSGHKGHDDDEHGHSMGAQRQSWIFPSLLAIHGIQALLIGWICWKISDCQEKCRSRLLQHFKGVDGLPNIGPAQGKFLKREILVWYEFSHFETAPAIESLLKVLQVGTEYAAWKGDEIATLVLVTLVGVLSLAYCLHNQERYDDATRTVGSDVKVTLSMFGCQGQGHTDWITTRPRDRVYLKYLDESWDVNF